MPEKREQWGSRWGFILATVGGAVGLGNIWRFPAAVGQSGGGAFLLLYLFIIVLIGIPLMICELALGRMGKKNIVGTFRALKPRSFWLVIGGLGVAAGFVVLSYYSVIAGWSLDYSLKFILGTFAEADAEGAEQAFESLVAHPVVPLLWHGLFMACTVLIVIFGIRRGIEKVSKVLMPVLFVLLAVLAVRSLMLEGAGEGLLWFFRPDFADIDMGIFLRALGQVFFSLSLGMGVILTYGSYLSDEVNIPRSGLIIALADLGIAIVAGLVIIPAVFAFGLEPGTGPPLIFITLPLVFASMPFGGVMGLLFFVLLSIAAVTSAVSLLEVVVAYFIEEFRWSRKKSAMAAGAGIFLLGIPSSLSMGLLDGLRLFGMPFLDFMDTFASALLMPLAGLLTALFVGFAVKPRSVAEEIRKQGVVFRLQRPWAVIVKYVLPLALGYIFVTGLFQNGG